jgi:hypothetical protein
MQQRNSTNILPQNELSESNSEFQPNTIQIKLWLKMLYHSLYKLITNTSNIIYAFSINVSIKLNYFGNITKK